ncbi:SDR family NAD(P)-dependent oxidoreductase [Consotaella salsifontis]|uniref:3-oxoacyl-[acyl-carrier protein] reductase n=1 Tax=Consotaella salsifontis TaxID=1365950 RepID=A0A1T4T1D8_9HYPH|nr:SDR family oxidoreductase [Consotaella salsifontis]SKA34265.1 3-oxoacyl-[acyl-carrier protein] reductase [Consotaella salsifontis]
MTQQLDGKVALIIGAGGGIGGAIAELFAREGASLCLVDRRAETLEASATRCAEHAEVLPLVADVNDEAAVEDIVRQCASRFGRIDVLVNSSGAISEVHLRDMSVAQWQEVLTANLLAVFLACRAVLPQMERQGRGRIINIASQIGQKGAPRFTHYAAAKAGVIGFTKSLAKEVAGKGILVNAIAPGPVETSFNDSLSPATLSGTQNLLPLGRAAVPAEIAPTALLLASSPGGDAFVGQTVGPNCGDVML